MGLFFPHMSDPPFAISQDLVHPKKKQKKKNQLPFFPYQTEDVELAARAMLRKHKLRFCPQSRSGELPPASLRALYRQRLRWATGWDQVKTRERERERERESTARAPPRPPPAAL